MKELFSLYKANEKLMEDYERNLATGGIQLVGYTAILTMDGTDDFGLRQKIDIYLPEMEDLMPDYGEMKVLVPLPFPVQVRCEFDLLAALTSIERSLRMKFPDEYVYTTLATQIQAFSPTSDRKITILENDNLIHLARYSLLHWVRKDRYARL